MAEENNESQFRAEIRTQDAGLLGESFDCDVRWLASYLTSHSFSQSVSQLQLLEK
jgi:hypothetical protein